MKNPFLLLAIFASLTWTYAQEAPERTCRIVFLDRPADAPKTLHLFDGTASQEVDLPSMNLSPVYKLAAGTTHLRLLPAKVEDPETISPDAPSVEIPADHTDFFLIISSDPKNEIAPVSIQAFNPKTESFKLGQMLWINLTDKTIEGKIGDQTLSLKPESSDIVEAPRSDRGDYPISLSFLIEGKDTSNPICETVWQHNPTSRSVVIVSASQGRRVPRVSSFSDYR